MPSIEVKNWALSSEVQSASLITGWSWVRVPEGPPYAPVTQLAECRSSKQDGRVRAPLGAPYAGVAQLVEQLFCTQQVVGSTPATSSNFLLGGATGHETTSRSGL